MQKLEMKESNHVNQNNNNKHNHNSNNNHNPHNNSQSLSHNLSIHPQQLNQQHPQQALLQIDEDKYQQFKQMVKDLQFVQLLSNPLYILQLVDRGYFNNSDFIKYLNQLKDFLFNQQNQGMLLLKYPEGILNLSIMVKQGFSASMKEPKSRDLFILMCIQRNQKIRVGQK